jgi:hypothetical protein
MQAKLACVGSPLSLYGFYWWVDSRKWPGLCTCRHWRKKLIINVYKQFKIFPGHKCVLQYNIHVCIETSLLIDIINQIGILGVHTIKSR